LEELASGQKFILSILLFVKSRNISSPIKGWWMRRAITATIPVKRNLDLAFGVSRLLILQFAFISKESKATLHPLVKIEGIKE
jgi:hypothetical protein